MMPTTKNISNPISGHQPLSNSRRSATNNGHQTTDTKSWLSIDFDRIDYREAWQLQVDLIAARKEHILQNDIVLFVEHPAVFTLGRRGGRECLLVSEKFLEQAGIQVIQVERGGNITFHGPGQLVAYPIVDLQAARIKVVDFVSSLEEVMLRSAQNWGVVAERNAANRGIWVGPNKMGSIGIAVRRGISFHGLALNVNTDLTPFSWIQPCGLKDVGMTSIQKETGRRLPMDEVRAVLKKQFESVFGIQFFQKRPEDLNSILNTNDKTRIQQ